MPLVRRFSRSRVLLNYIFSQFHSSVSHRHITPHWKLSPPTFASLNDDYFPSPSAMTTQITPPEMSAATRNALAHVQKLVPPMMEHFHKGQLGRIAVIGGSEDYAGAPYFSAMASARLGCDMSHVICTPGAAAVIKTYSPNLMVHPLMRETPKPVHDTVASTSLHAKNPDTNVEVVAGHVIGMLDRVHALVIGPGLGRDALMHGTIARVIIAARNKNIPIVIDADALLTIQKEPKIIQGYRQAILTPNVVEFRRLCEALKVDVKQDQGPGRVEALAQALGGVTIIQKGPHDYISNGTVTLIMDLEGGRKRSGGQGDTLTGSIATFLGWRKAYHDKLWDTSDSIFPAEETITLAAFGGAAITRDCSRLAFNKKGRSLQASDLTDEVHNAFMNLFGEVDGDAGKRRL